MIYMCPSSVPLPRLGLDEGGPWPKGQPPIPVLYLYSEMVLPRPAYWPSHVEVMGHLWPPQGVEAYQPPAALAAFLETQEDTSTDPQVSIGQCYPQAVQ